MTLQPPLDYSEVRVTTTTAEEAIQQVARIDHALDDARTRQPSVRGVHPDDLLWHTQEAVDAAVAHTIAGNAIPTTVLAPVILAESSSHRAKAEIALWKRISAALTEHRQQLLDEVSRDLAPRADTLASDVHSFIDDARSGQHTDAHGTIAQLTAEYAQIRKTQRALATLTHSETATPLPEASAFADWLTHTALDTEPTDPDTVSRHLNQIRRAARTVETKPAA